jgi:single-stranded DNA-binding protein
VTKIFKVIAYDEQAIAALETLIHGDSIAVQGRLEIETRDGHLIGLFITALQVLTLRRRSPTARFGI